MLLEQGSTVTCAPVQGLDIRQVVRTMDLTSVTGFLLVGLPKGSMYFYSRYLGLKGVPI